MEQTILFCVLALALCQTVFLLNHRSLLRGTIFLLPPVSAAWLPCRSCSRQPDFASPHPVWLSALSLECRAAFFFC